MQNIELYLTTAINYNCKESGACNYLFCTKCSNKIEYKDSSFKKVLLFWTKKLFLTAITHYKEIEKILKYFMKYWNSISFLSNKYNLDDKILVNNFDTLKAFLSGNENIFLTITIFELEIEEEIFQQNDFYTDFIEIFKIFLGNSFKEDYLNIVFKDNKFAYYDLVFKLSNPYFKKSLLKVEFSYDEKRELINNLKEVINSKYPNYNIKLFLHDNPASFSSFNRLSDVVLFRHFSGDHTYNKLFNPNKNSKNFQTTNILKSPTLNISNDIEKVIDLLYKNEEIYILDSSSSIDTPSILSSFKMSIESITSKIDSVKFENPNKDTSNFLEIKEELFKDTNYNINILCILLKQININSNQLNSEQLLFILVISHIIDINIVNKTEYFNINNLDISAKNLIDYYNKTLFSGHRINDNNIDKISSEWIKRVFFLIPENKIKEETFKVFELFVLFVKAVKFYSVVKLLENLNLEIETITETIKLGFSRSNSNNEEVNVISLGNLLEDFNIEKIEIPESILNSIEINQSIKELLYIKKNYKKVYIDKNFLKLEFENNEFENEDELFKKYLITISDNNLSIPLLPVYFKALTKKSNIMYDKLENGQIKILVIEDKIQENQALKTVLSNIDGVISCFSDHNDFLKNEMNLNNYDAILLDLNLEPVNGILFLEYLVIKSSFLKKTIPILIMTQENDFEIISSCYAKGAFGYVFKDSKTGCPNKDVLSSEFHRLKLYLQDLYLNSKQDPEFPFVWKKEAFNHELIKLKDKNSFMLYFIRINNIYDIDKVYGKVLFKDLLNALSFALKLSLKKEGFHKDFFLNWLKNLRSEKSELTVFKDLKLLKEIKDDLSFPKVFKYSNHEFSFLFEVNNNVEIYNNIIDNFFRYLNLNQNYLPGLSSFSNNISIVSFDKDWYDENNFSDNTWMISYVMDFLSLFSCIDDDKSLGNQKEKYAQKLIESIKLFSKTMSKYLFPSYRRIALKDIQYEELTIVKQVGNDFLIPFGRTQESKNDFYIDMDSKVILASTVGINEYVDSREPGQRLYPIFEEVLEIIRVERNATIVRTKTEKAKIIMEELFNKKLKNQVVLYGITLRRKF